MTEIVIIGAGMVGLSAALLLAADGHRVTLLERDPSPPPTPGNAWDEWERSGVNQFRQLNIMLPRWNSEMRRESPAVIDELLAAGATTFNLLHALPRSRTGGARPGDDRFDIVTARRPVAEAALGRVAARTPGVTVIRGTTVTGLIAEQQHRTAVPHVTGVLTRDGSVRAELVVDASGRRSALPALVEAIGARRPTENRDDSGFVYYARHFRCAEGHSGLPAITAPLLSHYQGVSLLTLPCDNHTWGVGFITSSRDKQTRALRHQDSWQRAMDLYPDQSPWTRAVPITGVQAFAGLEDRSRSYLVDGAPVVTGVVAVGDSWSCSNPSLGRGATIGLIHAQVLRDLLRSGAARTPDELSHAFDEATRREVAPYFDATVAFTRHRLAEIESDIAGVGYETPDAGWWMSSALYAAANCDPDALRAQLDIASVLALPPQALSAPGLVEKVMSLGLGAARQSRPGPTRAELVSALPGRQPSYH